MKNTRQETIAELLTTLVSYRSYVPHEEDVYAFLVPYLEERGFTTAKQLVAPNRHNLLAEKGKGKSSVLIYMHMDTVPKDSAWKRDPLVLEKKGKNYEGLGCFDMKGGIAAFLSVIDQVEVPGKKLKLCFGIDEEGISAGAYKLAASSFVKDVDIAFCPEASIVPEDWDLPVMVTIGGRGRCVLEVSVPGKLVHGAEGKGGINAIEQAAILISRLKGWKSIKNKYLGQGIFFVRSIFAENDGLSIPNLAKLEIDYQLVPGQTPEGMQQSLHTFIANLYLKDILAKELHGLYTVRLKERKTPYVAPYLVEQNNPYVKQVKQLLKKNFGKQRVDYAKSVGDQNVLVNAGIPTITIGPLGGNAHQSNEWVSIASLELVAKLYVELFKQL